MAIGRGEDWRPMEELTHFYRNRSDYHYDCGEIRSWKARSTSDTIIGLTHSGYEVEASINSLKAGRPEWGVTRYRDPGSTVSTYSTGREALTLSDLEKASNLMSTLGDRRRFNELFCSEWPNSPSFYRESHKEERARNGKERAHNQAHNRALHNLFFRKRLKENLTLQPKADKR